MSKFEGSRSVEVSDEDSVSITSTLHSEPREEYPVEGIIAEREIDGTIEYLVRWEGYPDERCTWEPESSFQTSDTLLDWKTQKMRVSRGLATPCDVDTLLDRVEKWILSSANRKSRRRSKRIRLGLSETPIEAEADEDGRNDNSQSEAEQEVVSEQSFSSRRDSVHSHKSPILASSRRSSIQEDDQNKSKNSNAPSKERRCQAWTLREESALMEGLEQVNGSHFDRILALYGSAGTVNQHLKARNAHDLRVKAQELYSEYVKNGMKVPHYLQSVGAVSQMMTTSVQAKKPAPVAVMIHPQKADQPISSPSKSNPHTSPTSRATLALDSVAQKTHLDKNISHKLGAVSSELTLDAKRKHPALNEETTSLNPNSTIAVNRLKSSLHSTKSGSVSGHSSKPVLTTSIMARRMGSSKGATGPKQVQMGSSGRGPARLSTSSRRISAVPLKKTTVTGAAVLKNWSKDVKPRKPLAFQPSLPKESEKAPGKFGKLSIHRKYEKAGRNEPAPEIDKLVFLNLKGMAKKPPLALPSLEIPSKTPYQVIQERLLEDKGEPMLVDTPDSNISGPIEKSSPMAATEAHEKDNVITEPGAAIIQSTLPQVANDLEILPEAPTLAAQGSNDRPSISFENYRNQTVPTPINVLSNVGVVAASEQAPAKVASPEKLLQRRGVSDLQQKPPPAGLRYPYVYSGTIQSSDGVFFEGAPSSAPKVTHISTSNLPAISNKDTISSINTASASPPAGYDNESQHNSPKLALSTSPLSQTRFPLPTQSSGPAASPYQDGEVDPRAQISSSDNLTVAEQNLVTVYDRKDVLGTIIVGPDRQNLGDVKIRGLEPQIKKLILGIKSGPRQMYFWVQHICTAKDFQEYYHKQISHYIGAGYVLPFATSASNIKNMAETLILQASGGVFNSREFSMLIYPVEPGLESWEFLGNVQVPVIPGVMLRFVLSKPLPNPEPEESRTELVRNRLSVRDGESSTSLVFRSLLGIEHARLIRQPISEPTVSSNNFFLFFSETAKREYQIIYKFLEEHQANIYTWQTEGAWDYFCNQIPTGVILIEGGFYDIYTIPRLHLVLRKPLNIFNITFQADRLAPHPHINRFFPHGGAILLTDSFLLLSPHEAARFVNFFRRNILATKPAGIWKLCTRPAIRDYLLTLIEERNVGDGHVYMQIYDSIWRMLPDELMEDDEWEVPKDEAPVYCMSNRVSHFDEDVGKKAHQRTTPTRNKPVLIDKEAIAHNDATLVRWFAGWCMTHLEHYRRMQVFFSPDDQREAQRAEWGRKWNHISIYSGDAALNAHKVSEWEEKEARRQAEKNRSAGGKQGGAGSSIAGNSNAGDGAHTSGDGGEK